MVTATVGNALSNGSNDTVTRWRLATANTTRITASGIQIRALTILRAMIPQVPSLKWEAQRSTSSIRNGSDQIPVAHSQLG